jgi:hypothetical protein
MGTKPWFPAIRIGAPPKPVIFIVAMALVLCCRSNARAQLTPAYSFEGDLQGFGPNGGGVAVTLDTIGATDGVNSMKIAIVQGATFVGALTDNLAPEIGDPPGMNAVRFDLTITEMFPEMGFVDAGIMVFGVTQPDDPNGQMPAQAQFFANQFPLGDLAVGTHEIEMRLTNATHPVTFALEQSFNDIFGTIGSGPNDVIPTGFQIYINKSGNAPWTGYIDNIRVGTLPPAADADFNDDTFVNAADLEIWRDAFGEDALGDADGDLDSDGGDFLLWQRQFTGLAGGFASIPEPSSAGLAGALLSLVAGSRGLTRRKFEPIIG